MGYFSNNDEFDPDDSTYRIRIYDASAWNRERDGAEFAKAVLQVVAGDHEGKRFDHFMNLDHPVGKDRAEEALVAYGLNLSEIENFGDLQAAMPALIGIEADVAVSHAKTGHLNIRVLRTLTGESDVTKPSDQQSFAQAASSTNSSDDDKIPF